MSFLIRNGDSPGAETKSGSAEVEEVIRVVRAHVMLLFRVGINVRVGVRVLDIIPTQELDRTEDGLGECVGEFGIDSSAAYPSNAP